MSNTTNQQRSLKATGPNSGAYSASPTQLTLSSDHLPTAALGNPYQQPYPFHTNPHDPSTFPFQAPHHPYRAPQLQTQLSQPQPPPQQHSPGLARKRRPSDIDLHGQQTSNAGYAIPQAVEPGPTSQDVGISHQQPQMPSPVVKKGRTNTPWTPAEEQRLKTLRDAGSSWSEIAKTFPTRTEGSVKKHWYKDMHYAEFAEDEVSSFSAALLQAIKEYENNKWKAIGQKLGKPAKACEQFAKEQGWK